MDGLRFIQEVQRRRPGLPAILLTGFATTAVEDAMGGVTKGLFGKSSVTSFMKLSRLS